MHCEISNIHLVLGEPRGTSLKLISQMHKALLKDGVPNENISQLALECEGKIEYRLSSHLAQLKSDKIFMKSLQSANLIFIVGHSQGGPVSTLLAHHLISEKIIQSDKQSLTLLQIAGIHHGPISDLRHNIVIRSLFETEHAKELFEFCNPQSPLSLLLMKSCRHILDSGAKIICVGSWNDQVVPLYSALCVGILHPRFHRCIYIEGKKEETVAPSSDVAPLANSPLLELSLFAVKLLNAGFDDGARLLLHISEFSFGSLISGDSHSTCHDDENVFSRAIQWTLSEAKSASHLNEILVEVHGDKKQNDYFIPWILHKITSDSRIKALFHDDLILLNSILTNWKPKVKAQKELYDKLEPFKSHL